VKNFFRLVLIVAVMIVPLVVVSFISEKISPTSPEAKAKAHARYMATGRY